MDKNTKIVALIAAAALIVGLGDLWAVTRPIKIISQEGKPVVGERFGGTTGLGSLSLTGDLTVAGNSTFTGTTAQTGNATFAGDVAVTGAATITGTTTLSGAVSGVPKVLAITMTNGTNTVCAVQNTSGLTRVASAASVKLTATNSVGSTGSFQAGTSTGPTVTSTSPFIATAITTSASLDMLTATSTFVVTTTNSTAEPRAYQTWRTGEWITFNQGSTSVAAGTCYLVYY